MPGGNGRSQPHQLGAVGGGGHDAAPRPTAMPCTMGDSSPGQQGGRPIGVIGLWSPDTIANGCMSIGAVTASRRRRRGCRWRYRRRHRRRTGSLSSASPLRPRIAKRSWRGANNSPSGVVMRTLTGTTRPTSVSWAAEAVAVTVNQSTGSWAARESRCAAWSRVHQVQQTLDDGEAGLGDGRTDGREHRRPAQADHGVRDHGQRPATGCRRTSRVTPVWSATRSVPFGG